MPFILNIHVPFTWLQHDVLSFKCWLKWTQIWLRQSFLSQGISTTVWPIWDSPMELFSTGSIPRRLYSTWYRDGDNCRHHLFNKRGSTGINCPTPSVLKPISFSESPARKHESPFASPSTWSEEPCWDQMQHLPLSLLRMKEDTCIRKLKLCQYSNFRSGFWPQKLEDDGTGQDGSRGLASGLPSQVCIVLLDSSCKICLLCYDSNTN